MTNKFKVGDKVKCIKNFIHTEIDRIYTIKEINIMEDNTYFVIDNGYPDLLTEDIVYFGCPQSYFELTNDK